MRNETKLTSRQRNIVRGLRHLLVDKIREMKNLDVYRDDFDDLTQEIGDLFNFIEDEDYANHLKRLREFFSRVYDTKRKDYII